MADKTKHEAMIDYLSTCPGLEDVLFNVSPADSGSVAIIPDFGAPRSKKFLRGGLREYGFTIVKTCPYSQTDDNTNLVMLSKVEAFGDWIEEQQRSKAFPDFGAKCPVTKIEPSQNMARIAMISEDGTQAKYEFACKVTYFKED